MDVKINSSSSDTYNILKVELGGIDKSKTEQSPINMIYIYDRSGSMYSTLPGLVDDLISRTQLLREGDTVTVGWFSGENGQFDFIVKGMRITKSDRDLLVKTLQKHNTTIGLTCFSEILESAVNTIDTLSEFPGTFHLMFMTDGYPVVKNYTKEVNTVMACVEKLRTKLSSALIVGYGPYYNRNLLSDIATRLGSELTHAKNLIEFNAHLHNYSINVPQTKKIQVILPVTQPVVVCALNGSSIVRLPVDSKNDHTSVTYVPEEYKEFFVLSEKSHIHDFTIYNFVSPFDDYQKDFYETIATLSYCAISDSKADLAVHLLGIIGDVCLIDSVNNSWTNDEYGKAMSLIRLAAIDGEYRYREGKRTDYVPAADAFCLMDALSLLMNDEDAYFYPRHEWFNYNRIGKKTESLSELKFVADIDTSCRFGDLSWNKKRLNLSLLARIDGYVELPDSCSDYGLNKSLSCHVWRNYTVVKDGILNMESLPISMSENTFDVLRDNGMIDVFDVWEDKYEIYNVDLTCVPIINKAMSKPVTAEKFCSLIERETQYEFQINFLKKQLAYLNNSLGGSTGSDVVKSEFSEEQINYLSQYGIKPDRSFSPKVATSDAVDFYHAKEFYVNMKGFSSVPKVEDVLTKNSTTPAHALMRSIIDQHELNKPQGSVVDEIVFVEKSIDFYKRNLTVLRNEINFAKFGMLLTKQWFPDLSERDGAVVNVGDKQFTFVIKDIEVKY